MLNELFAQHPLPWRFDEQPDADGIVAVRDASGADVLLFTDEIAYVQMGRVVAALPELLTTGAALLSDRPDTENFMTWLSEREDQLRAALAKAGVTGEDK